MALGRQVFQDACLGRAGLRPWPHSIQRAAPKPAREVRIGDWLRVTNDSGDFHVEVLLLSEVRGPASVAQTLYRETEASRELRQKVAAEGKAMKEFEVLPTARPPNPQRARITHVP